MQQHLEFDPELIRRYDRAGPRYTSYPTANQFHSGFDEEQYRRCAIASNAVGGPLSLYFHLPFCATVCYYCACNKVITKNRQRAEPYLQSMYRELQMQAALFDRSRPVDQLHWGGGTPTFLSHEQMADLMAHTASAFQLRGDDRGEYSIEIDPRTVHADTIALLRALGFNRMSIGVQDFDPEVQRAVNRVQSEKQTFAAMDAARRQGFRSVSVDLIYGLPLQRVSSFERTLDTLLRAQPDRISVFNYAHLPEVFKTQRQIDAAQLPAPAVKLRILQATVERLEAAGYVYIGMDHFARPDDDLAKAQRQGTLHRNFQGYSTHADCDLVAFGITGIGNVADSYSQNVRTLEEYSRLIDAGRLPVQRGYLLDADDRVRREVITRLVCDHELDAPSIESKYGIRFANYFADELTQLRAMAADGLVCLQEQGTEVQRVTVTAPGRLLSRSVAMAFDRHLREAPAGFFSKVI